MSNNYRDCPRCSPPPMRWPRAECIAALAMAAWCLWFGSWLASGLQAMR